jgi:hypothetical protein
VVSPAEIIQRSRWRADAPHPFPRAAQNYSGRNTTESHEQLKTPKPTESAVGFVKASASIDGGGSGDSKWKFTMFANEVNSTRGHMATS